MIETNKLVAWLNQKLEPGKFTDYCPNGLQIQGKDRVSHIVTGVTASLALIEKAKDLKADAILVHHGYFWRNEDPTIRGQRLNRIRMLLQSDINLIAYHLPLDAHPVLGNNAQLARRLGLKPMFDAQGQPMTCGPSGLVWLGHAEPSEITTRELAQRISGQLNREPVLIGNDDTRVGVIAWCTGGAQGMHEAALAAGAQTYLTGEISEPNAHLARETGTTFISAGHHATERYGVKALGEAIEKELQIKVTFVDIDNPA